jgi:hypothetical protein
MVKLGIAVKDLGPSQLNFNMIRAANSLVMSRPDIDIIGFYENIQRHCLAMNFAVMQIAEAFAFDGTVVATTFSTAEKLLRFPSPKKRLFYVWDLEWLRSPRTPYRTWQAVYGNPELTLLARSQDHAKAIGQAWNREVGILEDFDLERVL